MRSSARSWGSIPRLSDRSDPLRSLRVWTTAVFVLASSCAARDDSDPASTRVDGPAAGQALEPRPFPELRSFRPPAPLSPGARTEDSPGFLGPRRDGRYLETRLETAWAREGPPLVWSMERGQGYASPAVQGRRVVFPHRQGREVHVDCLEAETGRRFWRFSYSTEYRGRYISDGGPRATPMIAGERVFVHGVEGVLHCLELSTGRVLWKRDLKREFGLEDAFFGVVSSPLAYEDRLVVNLGAPGGPCVAAFDQETGELVWGAGTAWGPGCASPIVASVRGEPRLFVFAGGDSRPPTGGLMMLDPRDGRLFFEFPFRSKTYESVNGATPVVAGERVFLTAAYGTGTTGLSLEGNGYEELWKTRSIGIEFSTPLFVDGHLYMIDGAYDRPGAVVCLDPDTGQELSRTDLSFDETYVEAGREKTVSLSVGAGSLIWADGRFLCLGDNGHLLWLECTPQGALELARAWLFGANETWTPPVLSRGLLYVCQNKRERFGDEPARLLCYDLRGSQ